MARNDPDIPRKPLAESPLPGPGRLRPGRDYAREYAQRKTRAIGRGFTSVRKENARHSDFRAAQKARGVPERTIRSQLREGQSRQAIRPSGGTDVANMDALEKADYYRLDDFSRSYVMAHWEEFGWFDSWEEAREWYYGTQ